MNLPDPLELMEGRQERLITEWDDAQVGVPEGKSRCPRCRRLFDYEPIAMDSRPDSPVSCYDCLSPDMKRAYDAFETAGVERRVLAAVLLDPDRLPTIAAHLSSSDFADSRHRVIFGAMLRLAEGGSGPELRELHRHLEEHDPTSESGGMSYLAGLDLDRIDVDRVTEWVSTIKGRRPG